MWSGGKDSALALMRTRARGQHVARLVNIYDPDTQRVRFHATRRELIEAQADAIGIELAQHAVPWERYDAMFVDLLAALRRDGFTGVAFGDIHLADVRTWFESRVRAAGLAHVEPIWGEPSASLVAEFVGSGSRAIVTCVEVAKLDESWLGRVIDDAFVRDVADVPIDPAGENGEYHSFVYAGPLFPEPLRVRVGARHDERGFAQVDLELQ